METNSEFVCIERGCAGSCALALAIIKQQNLAREPLYSNTYVPIYAFMRISKHTNLDKIIILPKCIDTDGQKNQ